MTTSPAKPSAERYFYSAAALLLLVLTVIGFQLFYFKGQAYPGRPLSPPIRTLVIAHGVAMSAWMLLSVLQPVLVAAGNRRAHMAFGRVGAMFAAGVVLLGLQIGVEFARVAPPGPIFGPLTAKQFMAVPVLDILLFAAFVGAGVWWRRDAAIHRPLMLLASLAAVAAAISRIDAFNRLYADTMWQAIFADFTFTVVIGAVLVGAKCAVFRSFDRWLVGGFLAQTLVFALIVKTTTSAAWDRVATFLLR